MKDIYAAQKERFGRIVAFAGDHAEYFPADKPVGRDVAELKPL